MRTFRLLGLNLLLIVSLLVMVPPVAASAKELTVTGKSINGLVFNDLDGDGQYGWSVRYDAEPVLGYVSIKIYHDGGTRGLLEKNDRLLVQTKTDGNGVFQIEGMQAGYYLVVEDDPADFASVTANVVAVEYRPDMPGGAELQIFFADRKVDRSQLAQHIFFPNVH